MKCLKEGEARVCPACNGSGLTPLEKDCPSCHGSGQIDIRNSPPGLGLGVEEISCRLMAMRPRRE
jgi:DnaJ-class molecular chaperone